MQVLDPESSTLQATVRDGEGYRVNEQVSVRSEFRATLINPPSRNRRGVHPKLRVRRETYDLTHRPLRVY